jgi:hypothetical protein
LGDHVKQHGGRELIYHSVLMSFQNKVIRDWLSMHSKGGCRGASTKAQLITLFTTRDAAYIQKVEADASLNVQLVVADVAARTQHKLKAKMHRLWRKGSKFLNRKLLSRRVVAAIRDVLKDEPKMLIGDVKQIVATRAGVDLSMHRPQACAFFYRALQQTRRCRKRRKKQLRVDCVHSFEQFREMRAMCKADAESAFARHFH